MWLSITAIAISGISLCVSWLAYKNSKSIKQAEVNSEVLTKIRALEIEYEKLIHVLCDIYKIVEEYAPEKSIEILKDITNVKEFLEYTRSHYNEMFNTKYPMRVESLESIKHHIESLILQTEFDKKNQMHLKNKLNEIVKLNDHIFSINKSNNSFNPDGANNAPPG